LKVVFWRPKLKWRLRFIVFPHTGNILLKSFLSVVVIRVQERLINLSVFFNSITFFIFPFVRSLFLRSLFYFVFSSNHFGSFSLTLLLVLLVPMLLLALDRAIGRVPTTPVDGISFAIVTLKQTKKLFKWKTRLRPK